MRPGSAESGIQRRVVMATFVEACESVLRFRKSVSGREALIHSSNEFDTHWLITYAVPSLEDSSRIFQYGSVIVERQTGHLYYPPSRSAHPIDFSAFPSNRRQFVQVTTQDLEELEREAGDNSSQP
jgi:hypothetical protein